MQTNPARHLRDIGVGKLKNFDTWAFFFFCFSHFLFFLLDHTTYIDMMSTPSKQAAISAYRNLLRTQKEVFGSKFVCKVVHRRRMVVAMVAKRY